MGINMGYKFLVSRLTILSQELNISYPNSVNKSLYLHVSDVINMDFEEENFWKGESEDDF